MLATRREAVAHLAFALAQGRCLEQVSLWPAPVAIPSELGCPEVDCQLIANSFEELQRHICAHLQVDQHVLHLWHDQDCGQHGSEVADVVGFDGQDRGQRERAKSKGRQGTSRNSLQSSASAERDKRQEKQTYRWKWTGEAKRRRRRGREAKQQTWQR